jgi:hypothetical protein
LNEKVAAPVKKTELTTGGIRCGDHATPLSVKFGTNYAHKRRLLGRYFNGLHGVIFKKMILMNLFLSYITTILKLHRLHRAVDLNLCETAAR